MNQARQLGWESELDTDLTGNQITASVSEDWYIKS